MIPTIDPPAPSPSRLDPRDVFNAKVAAYLAKELVRAGQLSAWTDAVNNMGNLLSLGVTGRYEGELTVGWGERDLPLPAMKGLYDGFTGVLTADDDVNVQMLFRVRAYDPVTGDATIYTPEGETAGVGPYTGWSFGPAASATNVGKQAFYAPARGWVPRLTNGPEVSAFESATSKVNSRTHNFDAATIEYDQLDLGTAASWNGGTISGRPIWSHGAAATNFKVSWGLQGVALSDGDLLDTAFGVAQYSNDVGGVADKLYIGPETAAVTLGNAPAEGDWLMLQCLRKADDAVNDTLAVDARLHGWIVFLTTDKATDAA